MRDNVKIFSILSYIGPLCILGYIVPEKEDDFLKFHSKQGLILFICEVIGTVAANIISIIPLIGGIVGGILSIVVGIGALVFSILGIVNVANNKYAKLPLIGEILA